MEYVEIEITGFVLSKICDVSTTYKEKRENSRRKEREIQNNHLNSKQE